MSWVDSSDNVQFERITNSGQAIANTLTTIANTGGSLDSPSMCWDGAYYAIAWSDSIADAWVKVVSSVGQNPAQTIYNSVKTNLPGFLARNPAVACGVSETGMFGSSI